MNKQIQSPRFWDQFPNFHWTTPPHNTTHLMQHLVMDEWFYFSPEISLHLRSRLVLKHNLEISVWDRDETKRLQDDTETFKK